MGDSGEIYRARRLDVRSQMVSPHPKAKSSRPLRMRRMALLEKWEKAVDKLPPLRGLPQEVLRSFEVDPDGSFVRRPGPDIPLGWTQFLQAVNPGELQKVRQETEGFNSRYGATIRKLPVEAGIPQSRLVGSPSDRFAGLNRGVMPGHRCGNQSVGCGPWFGCKPLHGPNCQDHES